MERVSGLPVLATAVVLRDNLLEPGILKAGGGVVLVDGETGEEGGDGHEIALVEA